MGQSINTGNVSGEVDAVITGSLVSTENTPPIPSTSQDLILIQGLATGSAQTVYTVTAGKTFYLFGGSGPAGAGVVTVYKPDSSTRVMRLEGNATVPMMTVSSAIPITSYAAGENVRLNGTNNFMYILWGVEE